MVVEESHDAVASDVEYNSVIRQEYSNTVNSVNTFATVVNAPGRSLPNTEAF
jgi:hypothetical protein